MTASDLTILGCLMLFAAWAAAVLGVVCIVNGIAYWRRIPDPWTPPVLNAISGCQGVLNAMKERN
jgi:hypothetical protein